MYINYKYQFEINETLISESLQGVVHQQPSVQPLIRA